MKILYDHQIFSNQKYGGISRYYNELMSGVSKNNEVSSPAIITCNYYNLRLNNNSFFNKIVNKFYIRQNEKRRVATQSDNEMKSIELLKKGSYDVFHPTYYNPYFLKYINKKPFVLTIYDMIHEIFPEYFPLEMRLRLGKKNLRKKQPESSRYPKARKKT